MFVSYLSEYEGCHIPHPYSSVLCKTTCTFIILYIFQRRTQKKDLVICLCESFISLEKKLWAWSSPKKLISETANCIKKNWKSMISNNFCLLVHFTCFSNQSPENGVCPYCVADEKEFNREHD